LFYIIIKQDAWIARNKIFILLYLKRTMISYALLIKRIKTLPRARVQNVLMTVSDRELALCFRFMSAAEREPAMSLLSAEKRKRVKEELTLQQRLCITPAQYRKAIERVTQRLSAPGPGGDFKSYLRPVKYGRRGS
jgi:hypothetical protein